VQHLVEDDVVHEEGRHLAGVERRVDADGAAEVIVDAEPDGAPAPPYRSPAPSDLGLDAPAEAQDVEPIEDLLKVPDPASRIERRLLAAALPEPDLLALGADEAVDRQARVLLAAPGVVGDRAHHRGGRVEEHVVDPQAQPLAGAPEGEHGRAVVGDEEAHRTAQFLGKLAGEAAGLLQHDLLGRDRARGPGRSRRLGLALDLDLEGTVQCRLLGNGGSAPAVAATRWR
jgi:hypothetical protein